nr:uncharacterized protein LOC111511243 [Leptinotarsa decemlineata]
MIHNISIREDDIKTLFTGLKLRADMNVKFAVPTLQEDEYEVFEVYKLGIGINVTVRKVCIFRNGTFEHIGKKLSLYESRKDMSGVLLRNGNKVNYSFETEEDYEQARRYREIQTFGKFHFQLFLFLKQIHNFHYNTTLRDAWFGNSSSGIDSGLASLINRKELDFMSSGGLLRCERIDYYDFLVPYYEFRTSFFFRNPGTVKPGVEVLKPFSIKTWYATIGAGLLMGIAIKLSYWVEYEYLQTNTRYSLFTSFVITISILAQQGSAILPSHLGGRIIFLNILIISMMLYNYYTSSLVSSLLSSKPTMLTSIKELYESNLRVAIENQPYTITYIIQHIDNIYIEKLNETKIYDSGKPNLLPPEDGIALVKEGKFAYHTEAATAYPLIARSFDQNQICDLTEINFITPGVIGLLVQKRSEYSEIFKIR